ncbi:recombinase family protein [Methylobacterium sp. Leaf456]|uniref:recombinase family protein n=1 Tax=Methylobacterium sp. Leaf456 TaxID=1736382 RepID=UPI0025702238|nr:recombinase family protein [Methylobacterium sp. Leaf456]
MGPNWTPISPSAGFFFHAASQPKLTEALKLCRVHKATLVIAKLDRLSRDAGFLFNLEAELQRMGLRFVAADMPDANELTIHIMAVVAQAERKMIGERTKRALAAAKARGQKLGGDRGNLTAVGEQGREISKRVRDDMAQGRAEDLAGVIRELREGGADSLRKLAAGLNERGIEASRGGQWSANQVARVLSRLEAQ